MKRLVAFCFTVLWFSLTSSVFADKPRLVIDTGGHKAVIRDVIFTHDGRHLVSVGEDKVVRVWDVQTGETVRTLRGQIGAGHEGKIYAAALSPDDRYLAVGGWTATDAIRIHDFRTGEVIGLLKGHTNVVFSLAFSPDGRYLASGSADQTVRLWDVVKMTQRHVLKGHRDYIYAVAFSREGKRVVSGSDDHTLRLWDAKRGKLIKELTGHENKVKSAAFSPDGRYLASGSWDKTIRLWDAKTGRFIKVLGRQGTNVSSLSFSPDSRWLLTGSGTGGKYICNIFSVPSGEVITRFEKHDNIVLASAVSPDGRLAATGGGDDHEIYLWNPQSGDVIRKLAGKGQPVWSVGFARDGRTVAFGNEYSRYENHNNRGPLQQIISFRQDSDYELALGGKVTKESDYRRAVDRYGNYELKTKSGKTGKHTYLQIVKAGKVLHEIERDSTSGYRHKSYSFTHDGHYVVSGGSNGFLTFYEAETGKKVHEFIGHTGDVWAVAVAPDNRTVVSGALDQTVRLWDLESGQNLVTIFVGADREWVAWTPQGYYTSSVNGDKYIGWHLNRGENKAAKFYRAAQFQKQFYRPDVVAQYLKARDIKVAVKRANEKRGKGHGAQPIVAAPDIRTFLPPLIYVIAPNKKESIAYNETLPVKAVALSNTLPVTDLKIFLNGIQVAGRREGKIKGDARQREVELEVTLEEGMNTLTFVASNEKASSEPEFRRILYQGKRKDERSDLILLAIGVSEYKHEPLSLDFAHKDAVAVEKAFREQQGRLFRRVKSKLLSNEKATRAAIIRGLSWLSREGTQKDMRVLFLSGHGGLDRQNNYFFFSHEHNPQDDLEVNDVKWSTLLEKLTSAESKAVLMVDTCRAAAAVRGAKTRGNVNFDEVLKEMQNEYRGVVTLAASTGREVSIEKTEWGHGAFTKALLEGLSGKADGYGGKRDTYIETKELGSWIIDRVKALTGGDQHATHHQPPDLPSFPMLAVK